LLRATAIAYEIKRELRCHHFETEWRRRLERDEQGVIQEFGVKPSSIPDYLALVGDAADGYLGLPGWSTKSASAVLSRFGRLEAITPDARDWQVNVSNPKGLSEVLNSKRDLAFYSGILLRFELTFRSSQLLTNCFGRVLRQPFLPCRALGQG
jgi:5'-3' exonuclease